MKGIAAEPAERMTPKGGRGHSHCSATGYLQSML